MLLENLEVLKNDFKNIIFLNIFNVSKYLPKTGVFSKLFYIYFLF